MAERRVVPFRLTEGGITALDTLAANHGVSRSDIARWSMAFAASMPGEFDQFVTERKKARAHELRLGRTPEE